MRLRRGRCVATLRYHWALRPSSAQRQYGCALVQTLNACRSPGSALPYILQRHRFYEIRLVGSGRIVSQYIQPETISKVSRIHYHRHTDYEIAWY